MPYTIEPWKKEKLPSLHELVTPLQDELKTMAPLKSQGNKPLQMEFEHQLNALIYFHLEEHTSGTHLLQVLKEDSFVRSVIAPP
ncbi:MAG: IS4 family transposase, partial [Deltaproteobacteria bacterium]|nr:IS4 family transposase [Deltaproteobacteria bacterium]